MASGWIRASSFQGAYSIIQRSRGGSSGRMFSKMTTWDVRGTVNVENLEGGIGDEVSSQTVGKRKTGKDGEVTHWFSSPVNVQVGMTITGMEEITATFGAITANVRQAAAEVLVASGERIKKESLERVPVRDFDLFESWYPDNISDGIYVDGDDFHLEIGYRGTAQGGVPYAWTQHEDASLIHPIRAWLGRSRSEWKFLEYPANDERVRMLATAMDQMKAAVARMGGAGVNPRADPTTAAGYMGVLTRGGGKPRLRKKGT